MNDVGKRERQVYFWTEQLQRNLDVTATDKSMDIVGEKPIPTFYADRR
jgi:hypothetical protein